MLLPNLNISARSCRLDVALLRALLFAHSQQRRRAWQANCVIDWNGRPD